MPMFHIIFENKSKQRSYLNTFYLLEIFLYILKICSLMPFVMEGKEKRSLVSEPGDIPLEILSWKYFQHCVMSGESVIVTDAHQQH